jgi:hypothetical protein
MDAWGEGARSHSAIPDVAGEGRPCAVTRIGRLIEVKIGTLRTPEDVVAMSRQILAALERAGHDAVICADHRSASPLPCEVADVWARRMRGGNGKRALSALLVDPSNSTYNLQIARVIQCALSPTRRIFTDAAELLDWVGPIVTDAERRELRTFLG